MKIIFLGVFAISILSLPACQFLNDTFKGRILTDQDSEMRELLRQSENTQLLQIEKMIEAGQFKEAQNKNEKFISDHPRSIYLQRAYLNQGLIFEAAGLWSEALQVYKNLLASVPGDAEGLRARASFQQALCFENIGDDTKALASLVDAEKSLEELPQEISMVEIPAKKAAIYYRMGQRATAEKYLNQASQGISGLRASIRSEKDRAWVAELFYKLGHLSNNSLNTGNLRAYLDTLGILQIFSLHSVEENLAPWSEKAHADIKMSYLAAWKFIKNLDAQKLLNESSRSGMIDSSVLVQAEKNELVGLLLEKIEELKRFQAPTPSLKAEAAESIFADLNELKEEVKIESQKWSIQNPLTPETQYPRGIKAPGSRMGRGSKRN